MCVVARRFAIVPRLSEYNNARFRSAPTNRVMTPARVVVPGQRVRATVGLSIDI